MVDMGTVLTILVPILIINFGFSIQLIKIKQGIKEVANEVAEHKYFDYKDKMKERYYHFKYVVEHNKPINILELKDAHDLVVAAKKAKVNGETTHMQQFIVDLYQKNI